MLGGSFINSSVAYLAPGPSTYTSQTQSPTGTPFFLYGVYSINEKMKAGIGVFTPFGSSVKWEDQWLGRYALQQLSLRAIYVQPTFSYKINDILSVGAGIDIAFGSVNLQRDIPLNYAGSDQVGKAELSGNAKTAFGYNLGVYAKPSEKFSVGLNYRSRVNLAIEGGDATFTVPSAVAANFPKTTFNSELPMPSVTTLGFGIYPSEKLTLALDVSYVGWSAYQSLKFEYAAPVAGSTVTEAHRKYKNSMIFKVGGQYAVTESFFARAGFYFDQTPVQDGYMTPETPDSNAFGYTLGAGYKTGNFEVDLSLLIVDKVKRTNVAAPDAGTISGTYKAGAVIPGISFSYSF
jgi:long-chain fatty acid transport protein